MKRYIIEAPDETEWIQFIGQTGMGTPNLKMVRASDAMPYEEPDVEAIEKKVWEIASKIYLDKDYGGFTKDEYSDIFGQNTLVSEIFRMPYAHVKAIYSKWKSEQAQIKVGDEVAFRHDDGRPDTVVVVTYLGADGFIDGMDGRGTQYAHKNPKKWIKTGRTFPEVSDLLEKMKGES